MFFSLFFYTELLHHWRDLLSVRPADVHHEVRLMDVHRRPGLPHPVQQQRLRGPVWLLEVRHVGHHRGAGLPERAQRLCPHGDGHHVLHHDPAEDPLLHGELNPPHRAYLVPLRVGVLPAGRGGRESHVGHQYSPLARCLPPARLKDPPTHLAGAASHCQVLAFYIYNEHCQYISHCGYHQLELSRSPHPLHAKLDSRPLSTIPTHVSLHEEAKEDQAQVDDGDTGPKQEGATRSPTRSMRRKRHDATTGTRRQRRAAATTLTRHVSQTHGTAHGATPAPTARARWGWSGGTRLAPGPLRLQEQDRGDGAVRPAPPVLQAEPIAPGQLRRGRRWGWPISSAWYVSRIASFASLAPFASGGRPRRAGDGWTSGRVSGHRRTYGSKGLGRVGSVPLARGLQGHASSGVHCGAPKERGWIRSGNLKVETQQDLNWPNIKQIYWNLPSSFQIREDWKFVAMVVDRLQLYVFFIVTTVGTVGILMDAPHIFEYVDQDKIIDIYRGK